jgi:hypothetical protein
MGAGVVEIFALEVDLGAAEFFGEAFGIGQGGRTADIGCQQMLQFAHEFGIVSGGLVIFNQFFQGRHQCFWNKLAAIGAEFSAFIG